MSEVCLDPNRIYTWAELGAEFDFKPAYLGAAGGMVSRPKHKALMLITHPGGAKSFDYNDYWEDEDLIYTGRGKVGDQKLEGQNKDVAENACALLVFEGGVGSKQLRFLGTATCAQWWWGEGPDDNGHIRKVLRFRLSFDAQTEVSPTNKAISQSKWFGGGESDAHKSLKEYVAAHPETVGLPANSVADIEHSFRSPDRADVVFTLPGDRWAAVEVELQGARNTEVGAWQAIKYRTLLCLEHGLPVGSHRVQSILVAYAIPDSTRDFCKRYDVSWFEVSP